MDRMRVSDRVDKGGKGIRATRVRHVHLAPHGAPVHVEDGLHLSVSGEGRKGAEPGFREEMAGNGLLRHKEGGRGKRFGDRLGGRIAGSGLRNKGARPCLRKRSALGRQKPRKRTSWRT